MSKKGKRFQEKSQKRKKSKYILLLFELIFIIIMIVSAVKIVLWIKDNKNNEKVLEEISKTVTVDNETDEYHVDFEALKNKNTDTVAWIKVNGTNIEYPVVKAEDNEYYLTHSFDKSSNTAGWIFADCRNIFDGTDKNIVVYGHNRRDRSMFGSLRNILTEEWYQTEENRKIVFVTEEGSSLYEVFSVYQIESEDYYIKTHFAENEWETFINTIKKRSVKDFGVEVTDQDQILTLSTCASNNHYRLVLHAKKIVENT